MKIGNLQLSNGVRGEGKKRQVDKNIRDIEGEAVRVRYGGDAGGWGGGVGG